KRTLGESSISSWAFVAFVLAHAIACARGFCVRHRRHRGPDLELLVAFDRGLRRTAAFFTPHERDFRPWIAVLAVDHGQRQHFSFVRAVAAPGRDADDLAVL